MKIKGRGYAWGLSSVILVVGFFVLPVVFIKPRESEILQTVLSCIQILWVCFPPIAFILAFIGKVRSEGGTKARSLCNIGAVIGWIESVVLMFHGFGALWMDVFPIPTEAAEIATFVDTFLIAGYFLIGYIRRKILWFI